MCGNIGATEGGSGKAAPSVKQAPTTAKFIENMNEAQINEEIAKAKREIKDAEKAMGKNNITNTAEAKAMREAFPLGYGASTEKQIAKMGKTNERDAHKAKAYTEAYTKKQTAQTRIENLEKAKKEVSGTGKTQKQINAEKAKKAVETAPKSLKWKTTEKGGWVAGGGYKPKVIKAGNMEIHGESGYYRVFKDGKLIGTTSKLASAKAIAEKKK